MSSSQTILAISDPHRAKHPFLVAQADGYWSCGTCPAPAGNERHRKVDDGETVVHVNDPDHFDQLVAVPLSLVLAAHGDGDRLALTVRKHAPGQAAA